MQELTQKDQEDLDKIIEVLHYHKRHVYDSKPDTIFLSNDYFPFIEIDKLFGMNIKKVGGKNYIGFGNSANQPQEDEIKLNKPAVDSGQPFTKEMVGEVFDSIKENEIHGGVSDWSGIYYGSDTDTSRHQNHYPCFSIIDALFQFAELEVILSALLDEITDIGETLNFNESQLEVIKSHLHIAAKAANKTKMD